ncbi:MAG: 1-(5-phosphoribosyl)-5-[(5-phosphoribosylamino)methylideneamino]imidazole-4-carboxamide isomerase [Bacillota bacterium]|jgi:phosphoribosylformimino-5-aminoimidazole carboxamide ribotide isomerase
MIIIPAIDLRAGKCVRLVEGKLDRETVYSDDPVAIACFWTESGAELIHVVDLDGAFSGEPQNLPVIKEIIQAVNIPVQLGGGIRKMETIEMLLEIGVSRVILGTAAVLNPSLVASACEKYGERIVLGIDSKNGWVAVEGWEATTGKTDVQLGLEMKELGITRVIFTDTGRDGTLKGPNFRKTGELARATNLKIIASGGVSTVEDIKNLREMEHLGVEGVILGKSLYAKTIDFAEALKASKGVEK